MSWLDYITVLLIGIAAAVNGYALIRLARRVEMLEEVVTTPQGCPHHEVINVGTFGKPAYQCRACGDAVAR